jgi:hypothetical protein
MASYARIWEAEVAAAQRESREPSMAATWDKLYAEYKPAKASEDEDRGLIQIKAYSNTWLMTLIDEHPHLVRDLSSSRQGLAARLWVFDYSPQIVIALLIEEYYGREEAAKYALALATGAAG